MVIPFTVAEAYRKWNKLGLTPLLEYLLAERGIEKIELDVVMSRKAGKKWREIPWKELRIVTGFFSVQDFDEAILSYRKEVREAFGVQ